mgnify:CR=1 FL=1
MGHILLNTWVLLNMIIHNRPITITHVVIFISLLPIWGRKEDIYLLNPISGTGGWCCMQDNDSDIVVYGLVPSVFCFTFILPQLVNALFVYSNRELSADRPCCTERHSKLTQKSPTRKQTLGRTRIFSK